MASILLLVLNWTLLLLALDLHLAGAKTNRTALAPLSTVFGAALTVLYIRSISHNLEARQYVD